MNQNYYLYFYPNILLKNISFKVYPFEFNLYLKIFVRFLINIMFSKNGCGIAAPQLGILKQIFVSDIRFLLIHYYNIIFINGKKCSINRVSPLILLNPIIIYNYKKFNNLQEGCLSIPNKLYFLQRSTECFVKYQNIQKTFIYLRILGFLARNILHEYDHLLGKLIIDKVSIS